MKERIRYWDLARGLAMLLVIFYHVPLYVRICHPEAAELLLAHIEAGTYILPFFMPVFFVISGYFTSSDKSYGRFLWGDVKHLLLVGLLLTFIGYVIQAVGLRDINIFKSFFSMMAPARILNLLFCNWFVAAIFFARQIYYWVDRLALRVSKSKQWLYWLIAFGVLTLVAVCGILVEPHAPFNGQWYYCQGLVFALFIAFGRLLRVYPLSRWYLLGFGGLYIVLIILARMTGLSTLEYGMVNTSFTLVQWPFYMVLALSGSALLIAVAQLIGRCRPLEFIGRHTLVFYIPQGAILYVTGILLGHWFLPDTAAHVWAYILILWAVTLVSLSVLSIIPEWLTRKRENDL